MMALEIDANRLWDDFAAICDCGGRQAGTASELRAVELLAGLAEEALGVPARRVPTPYRGWRALNAALEVEGGGRHPVAPLLSSAATPSGGLALEVVDLGRGTPEDFAAHAGEIRGRAVMVRHELMFAAGTIHRRLKVRAAVEAGAAAFLIVGPAEGSLVAGSSGHGGEAGIPSFGIMPETAAGLARTPEGFARIRLSLETTERDAVADSLILDAPASADERVVLSAHVDGHGLSESAMDNASGLAVALAVARALAPALASARRGLRLALFNVEEWALNGSAHYVGGLGAAERDAISLNVNLDTVAGGDGLTALTSGFARLEPFLMRCARSAGMPLGIHRPLQRNSDHANFAAAGIPAFRLVAGFGDAGAATRLVLTAFDMRDRVTPRQLMDAARLAGAIVSMALAADAAEVRAWRQDRAP